MGKVKKSKEINESDLNKVFNKSDRVDRILNDILEWSNK